MIYLNFLKQQYKFCRNIFYSRSKDALLCENNLPKILSNEEVAFSLVFLFLRVIHYTIYALYYIEKHHF